MKRFVFEFFDCFLPLIYFGWYRLNFKMLRTNIISVYTADELRRVATESLLPYLTQNTDKIEAGLVKLKNKIEKGDDNVESDSKDPDQVKAIIEEELREVENLEEEELFDDYLEMVMTFGYITLFASVFSFGATLIVVFILIESRSDIFKLESVKKRPIPSKACDIGPWSVIIEIFCLLAVFSNLIVTCFTTDQIDSLIPFLAGLKNTSIESLTTVFALEHILFGFIAFMKIQYDCDPHWVELYISRKNYKKERN
jgi:anoctamin-10